MSFFIKQKNVTGNICEEEVGVKIDKENESISILDRIVTFVLTKDKKYLIATEDCDYYFEIALHKSEVKLLIDGLQNLYDKMIDSDHNTNIKKIVKSNFE